MSAISKLPDLVYDLPSIEGGSQYSDLDGFLS